LAPLPDLDAAKRAGPLRPNIGRVSVARQSHKKASIYCTRPA
jgi:hypothetical protein